MKKPSKKLVAGLGVAIAAVVSAGIAYAAWSSTGSGSGSATATSAKSSVIASATAPADLYPGAQKTITVSISNPNDYPVIVTGIGAGSSDATGTEGACAAATVRTDARTDAAGLAQSDGTTKSIAGNGSGTYTLVSRMSNSATDACQGASFTLPLTANLLSAATAQGF